MLHVICFLPFFIWYFQWMRLCNCNFTNRGKASCMDAVEFIHRCSSWGLDFLGQQHHMHRLMHHSNSHLGAQAKARPSHSWTKSCSEGPERERLLVKRRAFWETCWGCNRGLKGYKVCQGLGVLKLCPGGFLRRMVQDHVHISGSWKLGFGWWDRVISILPFTSVILQFSQSLQDISRGLCPFPLPWPKLQVSVCCFCVWCGFLHVSGKKGWILGSFWEGSTQGKKLIGSK